MFLYELAHARTGDKGNIVTISLIAFRKKDFDLIQRRVTAERVAEHFAGITEKQIERYELAHLGALNFVIRRPLSQTVTKSLALDAHGKCLGSALLALEV